MTTEIAAQRNVVFDLARSIDLQAEVTGHTHDRNANDGVAELLRPGETVTWETTILGIRQRLTSKITGYDRPHAFRDSMVRGPLKRFDHDLIFEVADRGTVLHDIFDFTSPLGQLGRIADVLFVKRYLSNLLQARNEKIREVAESGKVNRYLSAENDDH